MPRSLVVLEYLKVLLSAPVMGATTTLVLAFVFRESITSLFRRIASLRVAGLGELQTSQAARSELETPEGKDNPAPLPAESKNAVALTTQTADPVAAEKLRAERERAYLWEYRYLNLYLVRGTQMVLDWFAGRTGPTTQAVYDSWWAGFVLDPNERFVRIATLKSHYLLVETDGLLAVSEKGREYLTWRGPLPPLKPVA